MERAIPSAVVVAALLALLGPTVGSAQTLTVAERWSTRGTPAVLEFSVIAGMTETASGEVWISDALNRVVAAVNGSGGSLRIVARQGDGPGEVRAPGLWASYPDGGVAMYDLVRSAVEIFGRDGSFRRRIIIPKVLNPKGFAVLPTGQIVLSGGITGNPGSIHLVSGAGRLERSWHPLPDARNPRARTLVAGGAVSALADGSILFSQAAPHRIMLYPTTGGKERVIASDSRLLEAVGDDFIVERDGKRTFRWRFPQSRAVYRLRSGNVLNVVWNAEERFSLWEVYSPAGKLLARSRVNRAYHPWAMARNGDVLASYQDPETDEHVAVRLAVTAP